MGLDAREPGASEANPSLGPAPGAPLPPLLSRSPPPPPPHTHTTALPPPLRPSHAARPAQRAAGGGAPQRADVAAGNLAGVAVHARVGSADAVVQPWSSRRMVRGP
jgi:hypothetical protein